MKCLIVDDEPHARKSLEKLVLTFQDDLEVVGMADSAEMAESKIIELNPDLVFLDIMLGNETSISMLKRMESIDFKIIFTTSHESFAFDAFKYGAIHYLLKPVELNALREAVRRVKEEAKGRNKTEIIESINKIQENLDDKKIAISDRSGFQILYQNTISYCMAQGNYTEIFLIGGEKKVVSKAIGVLENKLDEKSFCRVHKKYLINLNQVVFIEKGNPYTVYLKNGDHVHVSPKYKDDLLNKMRQQIDFLSD